MSENITITLEKDGQQKVLSFTISRGGLKMVKLSGTLSKMAMQGWQVSECVGDGPMASMIKREIIRYKADKIGYKVPIKETVKLGAVQAGADFSRVKEEFKKRFGVNVE